MSVLEYFYKEGIRFTIEGNKPQVLKDDKYVWIVEHGKASVFLTTIAKDNLPGTKSFLFEVKKGDLIFGINPKDLHYKKTFLVSGLAGSSLIRLEIVKLRKLLDNYLSQEVENLVKQWLGSLEKVIKANSISELEIASELLEHQESCEYLMDSQVMENYHNEFIQSITSLINEKNLAERKRLKEKAAWDKQVMANSIRRITVVNHKEKTVSLEDESGDVLLDTCRLIGRSMGMHIIAPPKDSVESHNNCTLDDIAKASHIRTRQVILKEDWYKQDGGPILGYMQDDDRPIALIPKSPSKYILHDLTLNTEKHVDKSMASKVKYSGFVFYRPFENKKITIRELLSFGFESCWMRDFVMIILMGILGGMLNTAIPLSTGIVFNSIIPEGEKGQLLQIALFLAISAAAVMIFQFTRSIASLRMESKIDGALQAAVWDRLLSLPVPFFRQFSAGELAMRAMGINRIRSILSGVTLNAILSGIFSIFTFALLFYYNVKLALAATVLVTIAILVMSSLGYLQVRCERKVLEIANDISGMLLQFIGGITKFHVAGAERRAFNQWSKKFSAQRRLTFKKETLRNWLTTFNAIFPVLSSMIIFYQLTTATGSLQPGQFIAFNSAFTSFMFSMASLSEAIIGINSVIPLYQKFKPIIEALPEYDDTKVNPKILKGSIEVSHISFRYKDDEPLVLKDISFHINEGDYVALVGTSGCGKSTLLRILLGFEQIESGKVYYDGQDLSKIDVRAVRRQLGVVLQNGQLMTGNIFSNIIGTNPYLTIDDAWEAAKMSGIDEDIKEMPMGMFTVISEGASTISGGQKQRIMIARAVIKKPKIIFFDEATSALDNRTQEIVSKSLDQLKATRIVIAHRLSTIINCNKIIVMDQGRIVESGSYQELMKNNGIFTDLVKRQLE